MNVLFLCTANVCRSPMAEHRLRQLAEAHGWRTLHTTSAGVVDYEGLPADRRMIEIGRESGLDLSDHRARPVGDSDLAAADRIVVMERWHRDWVRENHPAEAHKVVLLRELADGGADVPDPTGGEREGYRQVVQLISRGVEALGRDLAGESSGVETPSPASDSEDFYVGQVEERFRRLRAAPLMLSPEDFHRVLRWKQAGVPLFLALDALDLVFQRAAQRKPPQTPRSLAFCEPAVMDAFAEHRERQLGAASGSTPGERERGRLLEDAAKSIEESAAPQGARAAAAAALRALASTPAGPFTCDAVGGIWQELLEECRASLSADERAQLDRDCVQTIEPFATEMSDEVRTRALRAAVARRLRRRFQLPDLGLLPPV